MIEAKEKHALDAAPHDEHTDLDQIVERLSWPPHERLQYLLDMLAFEEKARRARNSKRSMRRAAATRWAHLLTCDATPELERPRQNGNELG